MLVQTLEITNITFKEGKLKFIGEHYPFSIEIVPFSLMDKILICSNMARIVQFGKHIFIIDNVTKRCYIIKSPPLDSEQC